MADYIEIGQAIHNLQQEMANKRKELEHYAKQYAQKEKEYQIALNKKTLKLKYHDKEQVGIIDKIVKGSDEVSDAKFERDNADAQYKACKASLESMRAEMSGLQSIYRNVEEV